MPANVKTMFYVREKPWRSLGTRIKDVPASINALILTLIQRKLSLLQNAAKGGSIHE